MTADELRKQFLAFFESKKHRIVPSDSLVPKNDPTLLFTSAGMNQFKDQFMGRNISYRRAATCQKCLRTADLDNVGKTAYHHTFFEMLGNFSFGDYFKKEAIAWAWEFMTDILKLPKEKLWVSVYKDDEESYDIWRNDIKVPQAKIIKLGDKENFWPSDAKKEGPNGPCGPCSEIFYDWGKDTGCGRKGCNPGCGCGRFVEVWNLVFTQFNRVGVDSLEPLKSKNIDTGMGLERLASVTQGVYTNFETDLFKPIVDSINRLLKAELQSTVHSPQSTEFGLLPTVDRGPSTIYAIADHARAVCFAILDGVMPSNEGRGYVIRKLIRTSILHARAIGINKPFLYKLTFSIAGSMKEPYPELLRRHEDIATVIKSEEENFQGNLDLDRAESLYEEKFREFKPKTTKAIISSSAEVCCFLNDTYGIPLELTKDIAKKKGHISDEALWQDVFSRAVEELREKSRRKSRFVKDTIFAETKAAEIAGAVGNTEFVGYKQEKTEAKVLKLYKDNKEAQEAKEGDNVEIIIDRTSFYAESGGQVGDSGIISNKNTEVNISDAIKFESVIVHIGKVAKGRIKTGDIVTAAIDKERRGLIAKNHTATHLLHNALRKILGEHVHQSGSVVDDKRLRFDFTHPKKVTADEIRKIEDAVNEYIRNADPVSVKENVEYEKARNEGVIALFGEKYDKFVRLVDVGGYSRELCGGAHVNKTSDIRLFKITSEGSVAAGLRRIEAVTDAAAADYVIEEERAIINKLNDSAASVGRALDKLDDKNEVKTRSLKVLFKVKDIKETVTKPVSYEKYLNWEKEEKSRLAQLVETLEELKSKIEKDIFSAKASEAGRSADDIIKSAQTIGDSLVISKEIKDIDSGILRLLTDEVKKKISSGIIMLASAREDKISFACAVTDDLIKKGFSAARLVKEASNITGGGGGGRPDFAQAGGKDLSKLNEALNYVYKISRQELRP